MQEILKIFATDSQISCLIVQRKLKRHLTPGEDPLLVKDNEFYVFELQMKPLGESNGGAAMVLYPSHYLALPSHDHLPV